MSWLAFALLSVLGTSVSNIYRRIAMKNDETDPYVSAIIFQFLGAAMIFTLAVIVGFKIPPIFEYPINFFLNAFLWGMATLLLFKAYQYLEASEATILATLETIVAILASIWFLNEEFDMVKVIGTVLIFSAVILVSYKKGGIKLNKGVGYIVGYSVFAGLGIVNDAFITLRSDALSFLSVAFLLPGIFITLAYIPKFERKAFKLNKDQWKNMFILTFAYAFAASAWFLAIASGGQASQITPINHAAVILTVILGIFFLKERSNILKKLISAVLVTIGVFLISK